MARKTALVEPLVLVPCCSKLTRRDAEILERDLVDVGTLLEINRARFYWTLELVEMHNQAFTNCWPESEGWRYREAHRLSLSLLDRRSEPLCDCTSEGLECPLSEATEDSELLQGWRGLIASAVTACRDSSPGDSQIAAFVSQERGSSLASTEVLAQLEDATGVFECRLLRFPVPISKVPDGWSPALDWDALRNRLEEGQPSIKYEKSGHQAKASLKRALEQVVTASGVVRLAQTVYFNPGCAESCRVIPLPEPYLVEILLSDGSEAVKARLHTVAETELEGVAITQRLDELLREYCARHQLSWRG